MNNLSVALSLCYHFPLLGTTATLVPLSWGVLRVYFGVHYVSDILGGFVLALGLRGLGRTALFADAMGALIVGRLLAGYVSFPRPPWGVTLPKTPTL
jgi:undecaprenyl-diphosphatase